MNLKTQRDKLEETAMYKEYKEEYPDAYFVHVFSMHAPGQQHPQFAYAIPDGKITAFTLEPPTRHPEDAPFNQGERIKELDLDAVTVSPEEAEKKALEELEKQHKGHDPQRIILVLQHLDQQLYNITVVTTTFQMFTIRIGADTGTVLSSSFRSIMDLKQ